MNGLAIAAAPLGAAGLGTLTAGWGHLHAGVPARPETIRMDAVLNILAEAAAERAEAETIPTIGQER